MKSSLRNKFLTLKHKFKKEGDQAENNKNME